MTSATGDRRKQRELMNQQTRIKAAAENATRDQPTRLETSRCLAAVRGFSLSISQSAMRLNAIAAVLAKTIARTISNMTRVAGKPREATIIEPMANGNANTVWENRTNFRILSTYSITGSLIPTGRFPMRPIDSPSFLHRIQKTRRTIPRQASGAARACHLPTFRPTAIFANRTRRAQLPLFQQLDRENGKLRKPNRTSYTRPEIGSEVPLA